MKIFVVYYTTRDARLLIAAESANQALTLAIIELGMLYPDEAIFDFDCIVQEQDTSNPTVLDIRV